MPIAATRSADCARARAVLRDVPGHAEMRRGDGWMIFGPADDRPGA